MEYGCQREYLHNFACVRPVVIHIRVDVVVTVPAVSRRRTVGTSSIGRVSILPLSVIRNSLLFPSYSWFQRPSGGPSRNDRTQQSYQSCSLCKCEDHGECGYQTRKLKYNGIPPLRLRAPADRERPTYNEGYEGALKSRWRVTRAIISRA